MSVNADSLPIEDLNPAEVPVSPPVQEPVAPPVEEAPKEEPVVQDKQPQHVPNETVPRWRLNEVLEQVRQLKAQVPQAPQQQPQQPAAPTAPKEEDFADWPSYNAAIVAHTVQQELQKHGVQQAQEAQARQFHDRIKTADNTWEEKVYAESAKDPKFIETLTNAPALRPDLQLMLKESDDPIALAKYLAANPAQVIAMNQMPYEKSIREMTKAEMSLTTGKAGPSKIPAKQVPDLDPVRGGNTPAPKNAYRDAVSEVDYVAATRKLPTR